MVNPYASVGQMPLRFSRRFSPIPGLRLNLSKVRRESVCRSSWGLVDGWSAQRASDGGSARDRVVLD
jgi:hypothetical protein